MSEAAATIEIRSADPGEPQVRALIDSLDALLHSLYPAESNHLLDIAALRAPGVTFLAALRDGLPVGCGATVARGDHVEIKRMFVAPQCRGLKLGRALLDELEARAALAGFTLARLETGIHQPEARALYERSGYRYRGPFGDYREDPLSVFMEKPLNT